MLEFVFFGTIHPTLLADVIVEQFHLDGGSAPLTIQRKSRLQEETDRKNLKQIQILSVFKHLVKTVSFQA